MPRRRQEIDSEANRKVVDISTATRRPKLESVDTHLPIPIGTHSSYRRVILSGDGGLSISKDSKDPGRRDTSKITPPNINDMPLTKSFSLDADPAKVADLAKEQREIFRKNFEEWDAEVAADPTKIVFGEDLRMIRRPRRGSRSRDENPTV